MIKLPYPARGVRCIECSNVDLKGYPAHAKLGYGHCKAMTIAVVFVRFDMSRNCGWFEAADPAVVAAREAWAEKNPLPAWQR